MKKHLMILLMGFLATASYAQRTELGVSGGVTYYMGELNPTRPFELTRPAFGAVYKHNFHTRIALKAGFLAGSVQGDDLITKYREERALNFSSNIYELALMLEFNFLDYFTGSNLSYVSPYIFAGAGAFMFNPKATYTDPEGNLVTYTLRNERTEAQIVPYSRFSMVFPFGVGIKYSISNTIGLSLEWGMRKTMTDYLDDVSTVYPPGTTGSFTNPQNNAPVDPSGYYSTGMQRGNSKDNDWYSFAGLSVLFRVNFSGKAHCEETDKVRF